MKSPAGFQEGFWLSVPSLLSPRCIWIYNLVQSQANSSDFALGRRIPEMSSFLSRGSSRLFTSSTPSHSSEKRLWRAKARQLLKQGVVSTAILQNRPHTHIHPLLQRESKERRRHGRKATRHLGATVRRHDRRCGRARGRARGRRGRSPVHGARAIAALAHGEGRVGHEWLLHGLVARAGGVGGERARLDDADGLQLGALGGDDDGGGGAAEAEEGGEGLADGGDVVGGDAEGGGGEADLGDEVAELVFVEGHVPGCGLDWGSGRMGEESFTCGLRIGWSRRRTGGSPWTFPRRSSREGHRSTRTSGSRECCESHVSQCLFHSNAFCCSRILTVGLSLCRWQACSSTAAPLPHHPRSSAPHRWSRHRWWRQGHRQSTAGG